MFKDIALPSAVPGVGFISSPRFRTSIQVNAAGRERRNQEWEHPLHYFVLPEAIARDWAVVDALKHHFMIMRGPLHSFPLRDPVDFATVAASRPNVVPTVTMTDQALGIGDGFTDRFQLTKRYEAGDETYDRDIKLPVLASVLIAADGVLVPASDYTVSRPGGEVLFDVPPDADVELTAGFLFDVEVRFEGDDALDQIMRATKVAGFADLTLVEVRAC